MPVGVSKLAPAKAGDTLAEVADGGLQREQRVERGHCLGSGTGEEAAGLEEVAQLGAWLVGNIHERPASVGVVPRLNLRVQYIARLVRVFSSVVLNAVQVALAADRLPLNLGLARAPDDIRVKANPESLKVGVNEFVLSGRLDNLHEDSLLPERLETLVALGYALHVLPPDEQESVERIGLAHRLMGDDPHLLLRRGIGVMVDALILIVHGVPCIEQGHAEHVAADRAGVADRLHRVVGDGVNRRGNRALACLDVADVLTERGVVLEVVALEDGSLGEQPAPRGEHIHLLNGILIGNVETDDHLLQHLRTGRVIDAGVFQRGVILGVQGVKLVMRHGNGAPAHRQGEP